MMKLTPNQAPDRLQYSQTLYPLSFPASFFFINYKRLSLLCGVFDPWFPLLICPRVMPPSLPSCLPLIHTPSPCPIWDPLQVDHPWIYSRFEQSPNWRKIWSLGSFIGIIYFCFWCMDRRKKKFIIFFIFFILSIYIYCLYYWSIRSLFYSLTDG